VQRLQRLLLDRLDPNRLHVARPGGLEQRPGVGGVGLVALHVGAHILRQQAHLDAAGAERSRLVVRRAARFHDDQRHFPIVDQRSNCPRVSLALPVTRHCASAIASSNTLFATSTATVVAFMSDSFRLIR